MIQRNPEESGSFLKKTKGSLSLYSTVTVKQQENDR
jgi:hypothetical protein